jgi:adenylate cyclase
VAGILGTDTWHYDVWGDAVNVAARLQNEIEEGYVGVTAAVWERISGFYIGESLGERFLKGKGAVEVLAISARKPPVTMRFQRPGS